jgi:anti-anti-sigma factor
MALELTTEKLDAHTAVVTMTGSLTLGTNLKIADTQLQQLITDGVTRLVLDLTACPYSDSAGLGVLVHTYGLLREHGGAIRLCGTPERVSALLKMTKLERLLPCDPDRATSIAELG